MFRASMLLGLCILGLAFLVGTSDSQEKKEKKGYLPPGFKALSLTPTQDEKLRQLSTEYKMKIDEANKKVKQLNAEKTKAEFAVLTDEQKELYIRNKTGEEAKKKDVKKDEKKDEKKSENKDK
jgi:hypothetical protein